MSYKDKLMKFLGRLSREEVEELSEIFDWLTSDPGLLYHELSKYTPKWSVVRRFTGKSYMSPGLLKKMSGVKVKLPKPNPKLFKLSFGEAIIKRRSIRGFKDQALDLETLSTLLYYSAGLREYEWGYPMRMFPSAGALQPLELYLVVSNIRDLDNGIYHYEVHDHSLVLIKKGSFNWELCKYCLDQRHVLEAPVNICISIVYPRSASKYSWRAYRYVNMDLGHLGQNIYLVSTALGLGTCAIGAFEDDPINRLLGLDGYNEFIALVYPVGIPRK